MKLRVNFGTKTFFFVVITLEFAENRKIFGMKCSIVEIFELKTLFFFLGIQFRIRGKLQDFWDDTRIVEIFELKTFFFFFFWSSLFLFDPYSRIHINKVFVPPQNLFMPPQPRYPGAGPATCHFSIILISLKVRVVPISDFFAHASILQP